MACFTTGLGLRDDRADDAAFFGLASAAFCFETAFLGTAALFFTVFFDDDKEAVVAVESDGILDDFWTFLDVRLWELREETITMSVIGRLGLLGLMGGEVSDWKVLGCQVAFSGTRPFLHCG